MPAHDYKPGYARNAAVSAVAAAIIALALAACTSTTTTTALRSHPRLSAPAPP
jgi:hypothetical protein